MERATFIFNFSANRTVEVRNALVVHSRFNYFVDRASNQLNFPHRSRRTEPGASNRSLDNEAIHMPFTCGVTIARQACAFPYRLLECYNLLADVTDDRVHAIIGTRTSWREAGTRPCYSLDSYPGCVVWSLKLSSESTLSPARQNYEFSSNFNFIIELALLETLYIYFDFEFELSEFALSK